MKQNLFILFALSLVCKLALAVALPVTLDEYYYFMWGNQLSLSYFDHPPMIGWLMASAQPLRDIAEGAIRWPVVMMSHATLFIWYKILHDQINDERLRIFFMAALLNPLWGFGSLIATPDIPLLFFWSLATLYTKKCLDADRAVDAVLLGLSLGLGFLSKYQIVLFVPALLILLFSQRKMHKLLSLRVLAAIVFGFVACLPVILWNYQHDWASFNFQWKHGMSAANWRWQWPIEYFFTQILLIFPSFLIFTTSKGRSFLKSWLFPLTLFPFLFFFYSSFKGRVEANWVIMAFPATYALASIYTSQSALKWLHRTTVLWGIVLVLTLGFVFSSPNHDPKVIRLFEANKYAAVLERVEKDKDYLVYNYQLAGLLSFKKNRLFCKMPKYGRPDHLNYMEACATVPQHFYFIVEKDYNYEIEKDFPTFTVLSTEFVGDDYKFIEVKNN